MAKRKAAKKATKAKASTAADTDTDTDTEKPKAKENETPRIELNEFQVKQLLQDVEAQNLIRDKVNLLMICKSDTNNRIYGPPGPGLRRSFQIRWDYIKRMPIERYMQMLDRLEVAPSATTIKLFMNRTPTPPEEDDINEDDG
jgi:hypothetical protein